MSTLPLARILGTFSALPNLTPYHVEKLECLGIPPDALAGPTPLRRTHVHFGGDHFEFEHHHMRDGGTPAFVFLVLDRWGDALDIVAWSEKTGMVATWLGRAFALGEGKLLASRLDEPGGLLVWRSLVAWLKARQDGIVIVRPDAAALRLDCAGSLIAEDEAHGEELDQILTRPAPPILIPSQFKRAS
ncbi:hypothetical protein [Microvirga tunisiensis]|uniref:Uncharacterized protein n=1 Tax=Microvirga tunisiensis TaxID=2108360 RepID=A0A5N7MU01_9HYPH|nr:hypothetical protein [Microvirga tunisiensis]MPR11509.1 hypothetical protein [Microvirga tunisiensis]MPR29574.1 hypothetical protein [Microvirga tunisiensis]